MKLAKSLLSLGIIATVAIGSIDAAAHKKHHGKKHEGKAHHRGGTHHHRPHHRMHPVHHRQHDVTVMCPYCHKEFVVDMSGRQPMMAPEASTEAAKE